ncbi:INO80 complex subunit D-like [Populus alba x Populus x berolinensis]|uniref:INO80 complex subunit D-like n=3 Tax=Populus TaxID=3689 RepID=A0A4U5MWX9_POPAL|nr:INO80 complex subunit D-like [Populus alba]XP_034906905.1 INO80 complex subunit D-like [Populus alba]XP_034906906.1 INO80 complex subunit D-like [Populus alba]KAG6760033.1 hypothetical protein POTOM_036532 [Populus tomentosa]KAJ6900036.1 INO80 complex subunit D-like [Populus alba x Populus x berolinensis]KAJ6982837.1 INO80 complex subunit D-like [Populus alba x Populus x berolinensis]TKR74527.1 INO80 complex subunit D-like [Populus alba]
MANPPSPPPPPPTQPSDPIRIDGADEDAALSSSAYLTHQELLTRRSRRLKQLAQIFRAHYWTLMEELKIKHKEYYWIHGKSPYEEDEKNKKRKRDLNSDKENFEWNTKLGINGGGEVEAEEREEEGVRKCSASGCKARAMALTTFCYTHILSDSKQKLYKGCAYVVKSAQGRRVLCGKPALISTVPSLCPMHCQKAERLVARALKKAGLGVSSPSKLAPKLHVIVTEFVRQIQTKRRAALKENVSEDHIKEDKISQGS